MMTQRYSFDVKASEGSASSLPVVNCERFSMRNSGIDGAIPSKPGRSLECSTANTGLLSFFECGRAVAIATSLLLSIAGIADVTRLQPKTGLAPFAYTNAPEALPNY
ncbi:MAG TPA: hypothetical protein VLU94_01065, partial [Candidatus Nitrosotalea sp.]|nr:hypothetical protein [Candidatus Nitrosotalea sp.]